MKKFFFSAVAALALTAAGAQSTWKVDRGHSQLKFEILHSGLSTIGGSFGDFDATITGSKADFSDAVFEMTAKSTSINTGMTQRDEHLRGADYFDVAAYPEVVYKSTGITKISEGRYKVEGNLTFHGVTKSVPLELWLRGQNTNRRGKEMAGFRATGKINRLDFKFAEKMPNAALSENIDIIADGEFQKQ